MVGRKEEHMIWEYHVISIQDEGPEHVERILAEKGQQRWELVSTYRSNSSYGEGMRYIFKRPLLR